MELTSDEVARLKTIVDHWFKNPVTELEATFGINGQVDVQTFLETANRLQAKGYRATSQEERLNICLPDHVRFTLVQMGVIEDYCRTNKLDGKSFEAMVKDRTSGTESNVDLKEYNVRVKARREVPMDKTHPRVIELLGKWATTKKAFRLIQRWTFLGNGLKFDLSIVRSTPRDARGEFRWGSTFQSYNVKDAPPHYEIEVELERDAFKDSEEAFKSLMRGVGEVLRGIQKHFLLIRNTVKKSVLDEYMKLTGSNRFRGVAPKTLELKNMTSEHEENEGNIRDGYNVTDKADGLRVMGFCNSAGELYMIDMGLNVYRTGLKNMNCRDSLVDGEWVTKSSLKQPLQLLLLFDIYIAPGKKVASNKPFQGVDGRHKNMQEWIQAWKNPQKLLETANLSVVMKTFYFGTKGTADIFEKASLMLKQTHVYNTDGLIFSPNVDPLPDRPGVGFLKQFKWKPAIDNTVDFLVEIEKDTDVPTLDKVSVDYSLRRHKTLRLYVGSDIDPAYKDPRTTLLSEQGMPEGRLHTDKAGVLRGEYKPVLFNPSTFPDTMAHLSYAEVLTDNETQQDYIRTEHSNEPIRDRSIVEMRYDPLKQPGWRWIPIRVRADKTDRFLKGELNRTLNSEVNAETVWNSIHDPVTKSMIQTGNEEPTEEELKQILRPEAEAIEKKYFERKPFDTNSMKVKTLKEFHNKWIKNSLLYKAVFKEKPGKALLDLAVGEAQDIHRWLHGNVGFVLGVDVAGETIRDTKRGPYAKLLNIIGRNGRDRVPPMIFAIADSSKSLVNGDAGMTPEEKDNLRSIFGKFAPEGSESPLVKRTASGRLRNGVDVISCMFALHYFFESKAALDGLIKNISDTLKEGGYFICCQFDGERVFDMLRDIPKGQSKVGQDTESILWKITKQYDAEELPLNEEALGMAIDVNFITIGASYTEYLVPMKLLVDKLKEIGIELLSGDESRALGLPASTDTFENSHKMATAAKMSFKMIDPVQKFSFLNRWFVFKRRGIVSVLPEENEDDVDDMSRSPVVQAKLLEEASERRNADASALEEGNEGEAQSSSSSSSPSSSALPEVLERTVAVPAPDAVPQKEINIRTKAYTQNELFQFSMTSDLKDKLKIGDKGAARWLSPSAPFAIIDPSNESIKYPSIEHYLAAMKFKLASNKPLLAETVFSSIGSIHQEYVKQRTLEQAQGRFSEERDFELLEEESKRLKREQQGAALKKYGATINEALWTTVKQGVLRDAVKQRMERDERLRKIVNAARDQGKILLFQVKTLGNELGGQRRENGTIEGENRYGKMLMEVSGGFSI